MDFAKNNLGFPIYGPAPAAGAPAPRLYDDGAGNIQDAAGTAYNVDADGNPLAAAVGTAAPAAITQPSVADLVQVLIDDGIRTRMQHGRLTAPAPLPAAPPVAYFGLTPARANGTVINYTTREGMTLYRDATKPLYSEGDKYFGLGSEVLHPVLSRLERRAQDSGWTILDIVTDTTLGTTRSLLTQYGEVTLEHV